MTPLLLASLMNNYEIVKLLRRRGHKIEIPHRADCKLLMLLLLLLINVFVL